MEYRALNGEPGADVTIRDLGVQTDFSVYLQIRQTWLAFSEYRQYTLSIHSYTVPAHTHMGVNLCGLPTRQRDVKTEWGKLRPLPWST